MEKEKISSFRLSPSKFISIKEWDRKTYQRNALTAFLGGYVASISGITVFETIGGVLMLVGIVLEIVWIYKKFTEKKSNQKGFIQIPILIGIVVGILVVSGGTYLGVRKYEQHKENKISEEQQKITLTNAQGKALEDAQAEIEKLKLANETTKQEQENLEKKIQLPKVEEKKKQIQSPVEPEKIITIPAPITPPVIVIDDVKKKEQESFNIYSQNASKAIKELSVGGSYFNDALKNMSGQSTISKVYAQNSIDSCNSAYQININNTPPSLPFYSSMSDLNKIISDSAVNCKQRAQAIQESILYELNGNLSQAINLSSLALKLEKENLEINLQLAPKGDEVVNKAQDYFK